MKKITLLFCASFLVIVFGFVSQSKAQSFSPKGISQSFENTNIRECADGAMVAQERVLVLQRRLNTILNCNRQGQVYDRNANTCINPGLSPDHVFRARNNGDTLAMVNPDGSNGSAVVVGGRNGTSVTCMENPVGCSFDGSALEHGDTVTAYREATVAYGRSCESQVRTCNNGTLTGTYQHPSCVGDDPNSCTFNGSTVNHGDSVTAYSTETVGFGETCQSQSRTCTNGVLSGTYAFASCGEETPDNCTAPWGQTVNHGSAVTAYQYESVASSSECTSQQRRCNDGTLSGTYRYQSCEAELPVTPQPPTGNCFFYVSGITPPYASIGANDGFSDHVGKGAYPDAKVPFAKANAGTFDFIAIGPKTRLVIYKQQNFKGGTFIDVKGPKIIGNQCLPQADYPRGWKTSKVVVSGGGLGGGDLNVLKANSTIYQDMFPPSSRIERIMNHTSVGCMNLTPDPQAGDKKLLWGGGSVKVFCKK